MKHLALLALSAFFLNSDGCDSASVRKPKHFTCQGYVRSMWVDTGKCRTYIVFEGEDKVLWTIRTERCEMPPVWVGLHGIFEYEADEGYQDAYRDVKVMRRLP